MFALVHVHVHSRDPKGSVRRQSRDGNLATFDFPEPGLPSTLPRNLPRCPRSGLGAFTTRASRGSSRGPDATRARRLTRPARRACRTAAASEQERKRYAKYLATTAGNVGKTGFLLRSRVVRVDLRFPPAFRTRARCDRFETPWGGSLGSSRARWRIPRSDRRTSRRTWWKPRRSARKCACGEICDTPGDRPVGWRSPPDAPFRLPISRDACRAARRRR